MARLWQQSDDEFRAEIESHIAIETDRLIEEGFSPEDARRRANRTFGNTTRVRERFYESRRAVWLEGIVQDARFAMRSLRRAPGFAALAILTLAIGIGANLQLFSTANALFFRSVPGTRDDSTLVLIQHKAATGTGRSPISFQDLLSIRQVVSGLSDVAGTADLGVVSSADVLMPGSLEPRHVQADVVSAGYFKALGADMLVGRAFTEAEGSNPEGPRVAIVSERLTSFTNEPLRGLVGAAMSVNGQAVSLIGVAPRGFQGSSIGANVDLWILNAQRDVVQPTSTPRNELLNRRAGVFFALIGRLRDPAANVDAIQSQLRTAELTITGANALDVTFSARHLLASRGLRRENTARAGLAQSFRILLALGGLLFLAACANVGNASLARFLTQQHHFATRLALGAPFTRVLAIVVAEAAVLSLLSGALAVALVLLVSRVLDGRMDIPVVGIIPAAAMDWALFGCLIGLSMLSTCLLSVATTVRLAWLDPASARGGSRTQSRRTGISGPILMALQIAASFVVLVAVALMARSLWNTLAIDSGYAARGLSTFSLAPRLPTGASREAFNARLIDALTSEPAIQDASVSFLAPYYSGVESRLTLQPVDNSPDVRAALNSVRPGFFATIGLPLVAGRDFSLSELSPGSREIASPLILTRSLAEKVGVAHPGDLARLPDGNRRLVVGIVGDSRQRHLRDDDSTDVAFQPLRDDVRTPWITVAVRSQPDGRDVWPAVRKVLSDVAPGVALIDPRSAAEGIRSEFTQELLLLRVAAVFGGVAIFVAACGLYGTLSGRAADRAREFAIRGALGARPGDIAGLLTAEIVLVVAAGLMAGAAVAYWFNAVLSNLLYGASPQDPASYATAAVFVLLISAFALVVVASRATGRELVDVLRQE